MKTISPQLLAHKQGQVTSVCLLLKVEREDGVFFGFTDLDADIAYDDGSGVLTYEASRGFTPSAIDLAGNLSVDNADLVGLMAQLDTGFSIEDVRAGKFDYARVKIYQVNYDDLSMGHEWMASGSLGEVTYEDGEIRAEFRSLSQILKQNVCQLASLTCRAEYGDARCGKELVWFEATVTAQGAESTSTFTSTDLDQETGYFVPGIVEWLTGSNAGKKIEVEKFVSGGTVSLLLPMYYPILVGDTFRIRIDCNKKHGDTGCQDIRRWGPGEWARHFRGENLIPVSDPVQTPGAQFV